MFKSLYLAGTTLILSMASADMAAQTTSTIYGVLDIAVANVSDQSGHSARYLRSGNQFASRLGFKGSEDLGGGTHAVYVLEAGLNLADGTSPQPGSVFNRQSYVGLENERFGTAIIGRQYPPYFQFVGALVRAGAPSGTTDAHAGDIDALNSANRFNNSLSYSSPVWNGAQIGVAAGLGEQTHQDGNGDAVSVAARYEHGAWHAAVGYQLLKNDLHGTWDGNVSSSPSKSPLIAGYVSARAIHYLAAAARFTSGKLALSGAISRVQFQPNSTGGGRFTERATFHTAGASMLWTTSSPWMLGATLSYTRESAANGVGVPANYRQLSLEQIYLLSKRTDIYLLIARQLARGNTLGGNEVEVPAVAVVGDSQVTTPSSNGRQNVYMFGLRHNF